MKWKNERRSWQSIVCPEVFSRQDDAGRDNGRGIEAWKTYRLERVSAFANPKMVNANGQCLGLCWTIVLHSPYLPVKLGVYARTRVAGRLEEHKNSGI